MNNKNNILPRGQTGLLSCEGQRQDTTPAWTVLSVRSDHYGRPQRERADCLMRGLRREQWWAGTADEHGASS